MVILVHDTERGRRGRGKKLNSSHFLNSLAPNNFYYTSCNFYTTSFTSAKIPGTKQINNVLEFTRNVTLEELSVNCVWHFVSGAQAPLTLTLVDELFSVHKSTEKNGNSREIVESQGQTPRRARFGTCEISRQPNPDRLDFARWNYAALRNHARGSSAVARYRSLFIAWFTRCSFMMYSGRGNRDTPTGALFLFGFFEFILFTAHFSFTFQILLINFTAYDSFFFLHTYLRWI